MAKRQRSGILTYIADPMVHRHDFPIEQWMRRALELAALGRGRVEPNPLVGCVVVNDNGTIVGEGWHRQYGAPHAEIEALRVAGPAARGATMFVTLEPCCHHGKTPPCSEAIIGAGLRQVFVATRDPFPQVAGGGIKALAGAGISVESGLLEGAARKINAPYFKLVEAGRPWVIAKWAMTIDGNLTPAAEESHWISGEAARDVVHELRGRMDAIIVGRRTVEADDPLLTARPAGPRVPTRIVLDSRGVLSAESRLVKTLAAAPVLVATGAATSLAQVERLRGLGCEVLRLSGETAVERLIALLDELGRRRMTNVLVEGGAVVLNTMLGGGVIDEIHVFVAPHRSGGTAPISLAAGKTVEQLPQALGLSDATIDKLGEDIWIHGFMNSTAPVIALPGP